MIKNLVGPLCRTRSSHDMGAAAVELAITAPLLVLLALGSADYGALMTNAASLQGATRAVAEYARNSPECAAGGLNSQSCITGINNFVNTLQSSGTSLSAASFKLPDYPSAGTTSVVPLPAPLAATLPANYCTCTDGTVPAGGCSAASCALPDPRVLQYIRITATLAVVPLVSYPAFAFPAYSNAQTTTRIQ